MKIRGFHITYSTNDGEQIDSYHDTYEAALDRRELLREVERGKCFPTDYTILADVTPEE